jgi:hypothetical protein
MAKRMTSAAELLGDYFFIYPSTGQISLESVFSHLWVYEKIAIREMNVPFYSYICSDTYIPSSDNVNWANFEHTLPTTQLYFISSNPSRICCRGVPM